MSAPPPCECSYAGVWIVGFLAVVALILVGIIYIIYFVDRPLFLAAIAPVWQLQEITTNGAAVPGQNFTLYQVNSASVNNVTIQGPTGGPTPGAWFALSNPVSSGVTLIPGTGVTFISFPPGVPTTSANSSLPKNQTFLMTWTSSGTLLNLVPGNPA